METINTNYAQLINSTLSIEWILGGVFSIIVFLVGYIYIATLKDLKESIRLINESLKYLDKENKERDQKTNIMEYKISNLEETKYDSEVLADKIISKLRAATPQ